MAQRWLTWRNMDTTACPSYGCVRVVTPVGPVPGIIDVNETLSDNEILGSDVILHGMRPNYDYDSDLQLHNAAFRGLNVHNAFNGLAPVEPGQTGLLTFDLPTWAAMESDPPSIPSAFGSIVTCGLDWGLIYRPNAYLEHTGYLHVLGYDSVARCVFVGAGVVYGGEVVL